MDILTQNIDKTKINIRINNKYFEVVLLNKLIYL